MFKNWRFPVFTALTFLLASSTVVYGAATECNEQCLIDLQCTEISCNTETHVAACSSLNLGLGRGDASLGCCYCKTKPTPPTLPPIVRCSDGKCINNGDTLIGGMYMRCNTQTDTCELARDTRCSAESDCILAGAIINCDGGKTVGCDGNGYCQCLAGSECTTSFGCPACSGRYTRECSRVHGRGSCYCAPCGDWSFCLG